LLLTTAYQEILQHDNPAGPVGKLWRLLMPNTLQGAAALSAHSTLTGTAGITFLGLDSLWAAYVAAAANWASVLDYWRMAASVSRTDGTAGYLYTQVYAAEQAKDNAWIAWDTLRKQLFPAPPSQPGRPD
jgi:hypothetical protein